MDSLVASCKEIAVRGMEVFLKTFSFVPDDKLTWTPTPTAKSAIRIAAHTALYAGRFARWIKDGKLPAVDNLPEWLAQINAEEEAITSRTEMESIFRKNTEEWLGAWESIEIETGEVEAFGDRVVGAGQWRTTGRVSGVEGELPVYMVFTVRDGRIAHLEWFEDHDSAVASARGD